MTIVVGMRCNDGVVIGADTEETADFRRSVRKISASWHSIPGDNKENFLARPHKCLLIGGAGMSDHIDAIGQLLQNDINAESGDLEKRFTEIISQYYRDHVLCWPSPEERQANDFSLIIATSTPNSTPEPNIDMWISSRTTLRPVDIYDAIGIGSNYAKSLIDGRISPLHDKNITSILAVDVIKKVKRDIQYCGKDTQIYWITRQGNIVSLSEEIINKIEKVLDEYENAQMEQFIELLSNGEDTPMQGFRKDFGNLKDEIQKAFKC